MSFKLMWNKVDHLNAWWEPEATSTPLKKIPAQSEVKTKKQDQSTKSKIVEIKRNRKFRSSAYFDPSSSDDDSGEIKKRPIIRLSSKKNNAKILKNRNKQPVSKKINTFHSSPGRNLRNLNNKNDVKTGENVSTIENQKKKIRQVQNKKSRTQADLNSGNICADSDEENKISSKHKKNNCLLKENKKHLKRKINAEICSKSESFRHPSDLDENERKKLQKVSRTSQILLNFKDMKTTTNRYSKTLRSFQEINTNSSKLSKLQLKKNEEVINSVDSLKNKRNLTSKTVGSDGHKKMLNFDNPPILGNKSNLSHQLFSESTEQEYINTFYLTSDDTNETNERYSLQKGSSSGCQPFNWPYNLSHKFCVENEDRDERVPPKRLTSQKYHNQKDQSPKLSTTIADQGSKFVEILPKNDNQIQSAEVFKNAEAVIKRKNSESNFMTENCSPRTQTVQNSNKKQGLTNFSVNETLNEDPKSTKNQVVSKDALDSPSPGPGMDNSIQKNEIYMKEILKCTQDKSTVNSSENSVFKQLDELPFNGIGSGCSAAQCWSVNNVKCGVLKLQMQSQFACKTLHNNSHLGGVVVKGQLRMKIGIKEQDLKEGDMVFVPPLTQWRARNIGECESIFYYWCGRFGKKS